MNLFKRTALAAALFLAMPLPAAFAQWQTPSHSVPIGKGGGVVGFGSAIPSTAGLPLVSNGATLDPSFQSLTGAGFGTQTPNFVFSGPASGGAANPTFRALVGADIPNPGVSSLGGAQSKTCAANSWLSSLSTLGVFGCSAAATFIPTASTSVAIQAAIDAACAVGGGKVQLLDVDYTYAAAAASVNVTCDSVWVAGSPKTRLLAPSDATVVTGLLRASGTGGTATTLATNSAIGDVTLVLTSAAAISIGDTVFITDTQNVTGFTWILITKVLNKAVNTITLADPMPFPMTTADTTQIKPQTFFKNLHFSDLRFFGNGNSGVGTRGLIVASSYSKFENLEANDFTHAAGIYLNAGYSNVVGAVTAINSGDPNENDIVFWGQTGLTADSVQSVQSSGFGPGISFCSYCSVNAVISHKAANRGTKLAGTVFSHFGLLEGNNSGSTGVAITLGSNDNVIDSVVALSNTSFPTNSVGLWFSGGNSRNKVGKVNTKGNSDADISLAANDNNNVIGSASYATLVNLGSQNIIPVAETSYGLGYPMILAGSVAVNLNSGSTDFVMTLRLPTTNYRIANAILINTGTAASITTARAGIFTAPTAGGTTVVTDGVLSALTSNAANTNGSLLNMALVTAGFFNAPTLYFRVSTPQGAAASGTVYVYVQPLP